METTRSRGSQVGGLNLIDEFLTEDKNTVAVEDDEAKVHMCRTSGSPRSSRF